MPTNQKEPLQKIAYTPQEVMQLTGLGKATVYGAIKSGKLPHVPCGDSGRAYRIRKEDFDAWFASRSGTAGDAK
jgi:excisionase family DNA binding protein